MSKSDSPGPRASDTMYFIASKMHNFRGLSVKSWHILKDFSISLASG